MPLTAPPAHMNKPTTTRKPSAKRIAYLALLRQGANGCEASRAALRAMYMHGKD